MQISNHFNQVLSNFRLLPRHATTALLKQFEARGPEFVKNLIEQARIALETNYGIPYEYTEMHRIESFTMALSRAENSHIPYMEFTDMTIPYDFTYELIRFGLTSTNSNMFMAEEYNGYDYASWLGNIYYIVGLVAEVKESKEPGHEGELTRLYNMESNNPNSTKRRTRARFSRIWNAVFPGFPHAFVDALSDAWYLSYGSADKLNVHFHIAETPDDFEMVYEMNEGTTSNIAMTNILYKHLSNSCMQYKRDDDEGWDSPAYYSGIHCARAYGMPEEFKDKFDRHFKMLYLTNSKDPYDDEAKLFARCIFVERPDGMIEWGPIYCVGESYRLITKDKILNFKDDPDYKEYVLKFFNDLETRGHGMYPKIWEDVPMIPYHFVNNSSTVQLTIKAYREWSEQGRFSSLGIIFPYLDIGHKRAYPYPDKETGLIFIRVLNDGRVNKHVKSIDDNLGYYDEENGEFYPAFSATEHRGTNHLQTIRKAHVCKHCAKVFVEKNYVYEFQTKNCVCNSCFSNNYTIYKGKVIESVEYYNVVNNRENAPEDVRSEFCDVVDAEPQPDPIPYAYRVSDLPAGETVEMIRPTNWIIPSSVIED